jgi:hypothetical protein
MLEVKSMDPSICVNRFLEETVIPSLLGWFKAGVAVDLNGHLITLYGQP